MRRLFLGPPAHWLILAGACALLWWMGAAHLHTRDFPLFIVLLLAIAALLVAGIRLTAGRGPALTREPLDDVDGL